MRRWQQLILPAPEGISWKYAIIIGTEATVGQVLGIATSPSITKEVERAVRALYPAVHRCHIEAALAYRRWAEYR